MNAKAFANGSLHLHPKRPLRPGIPPVATDGGMVGVNVGIPVPLAFFPFSGNKRSFFGDLHVLGRDGLRFYTRTKTVTTKWVSPKESGDAQARVSTWEGTINREL